MTRYRPGDMWLRWVLVAMFGAALALIWSSCASIPITPLPLVDDPRTNAAPYTDCQRMAVVVGVSIADSPEYGGRLECPGADVDLWAVSGKLYRMGVTNVVELLDLAATKRALSDALDRAAEILRAGDLLILYTSGHGAQVPDDNGDEEDGLDEAACLADGLMRDDEIGKRLSKLRPGVRVDIVTDTCHAATGWRRLLPRKPVPLVLDAPELAHLEICQYAMCAASQSSYGDALNGGVGTRTLLAEMDKDGDFRRLPGFEPFHVAMPRNQKPVYVESKGVSDRMRYGRLWE